MITTYEVVVEAGTPRRCTTLAEVAEIVRLHPEARVRPVLSYRACPTHPGYEPQNCPGCGTASPLS